MGGRRYSRSPDVKRWQQRFDDLQHLCHYHDGAPTIGALLDHGIARAQWRCRSTGWQPDGRPECWHSSAPFALARFGRRLAVNRLRWTFVCSACGRNRPFLELLAE